MSDAPNTPIETPWKLSIRSETGALMHQVQVPRGAPSTDATYQMECITFQNAIRRNQEYSSAQKVVVFTDDDITAGLGARMLRIISGLWYSLNTNATFMYASNGSWIYTSDSVCPSRNNNCYFSRIAAVDFNVDTFGFASNGSWQFLEDVKIWSRASLDYFYKQENRGMEWVLQSLKNSGPPGINPPAGRGGCWIAGQLLYYSMQPNNWTSSIVLAEHERMGFDRAHAEPFAAVHVRHGDRAERGHQGSRFQLNEYLQRLPRNSGIRHILLMTEDQAVVEDARSNFSSFFFFVSALQERRNTDINRMLIKGQLDPTSEIFNALSNLYLAIDADYFIGHLSSTWGRLVLLLSYAKRGCFVEHNLMGSTWKSRWEFSMCTSAEFEREVALYSCKT